MHREVVTRTQITRPETLRCGEKKVHEEKYAGRRTRQCFFVKCQVLDREECNKKQDMEDGNSRNGYHKVKCQVPETEELPGREERGSKPVTDKQTVRWYFVSI